jgi:hypothetical protein
LCACEMLLPKRGPLPQISQTCAMVELQIFQGLSTPPERLRRTPGIPRPRLAESPVYQREPRMVIRERWARIAPARAIPPKQPHTEPAQSRAPHAARIISAPALIQRQH